MWLFYGVLGVFLFFLFAFVAGIVMYAMTEEERKKEMQARIRRMDEGR